MNGHAKLQIITGNGSFKKVNEMDKNQHRSLKITIAVLSAWSGLMFIIFELTGVKWFQPGDFSFRTAMAYHGILIPAWMMLTLSYYSQHIEDCEFEGSDFTEKLLGAGAICAGILTGIGSAMIHGQGFSPGTGIQISGMVIAEITALIIIIKAFSYHFRTSGDKVNTTAWWTVSIALIGLSLAAPLGHIAGAAKDFGEKFNILIGQANFSGLTSNEVINGYIGSHSHQIMASFLAAGFALPFIRKSTCKQGFLTFMEKTGLFVMATATIAQVTLYQYCAWFGWEPPDIFSNGTNGLPLDDFVLVVLGFGMLLLIPGLLLKRKKNCASENYSCYADRLIAVLLMAYMVSVVALGLYIEFHEQYFGHGQGNALGVTNDLAYIRAHILFGFMIIPALLGALLNGNVINNRKQVWIITAGFAIFVIVTGFTGTFVWTFFLNSLLLKISIVFTAVFLFIFGYFSIVRSKA